MTLNYTITNLKRDLIRSFAVLDGWFDKDDDFFDFKPPDGKNVRNIFARALRCSEELMNAIDSGGDQARKFADKRNNDASSYERSFGLEEESANQLLADFFNDESDPEMLKSLPEIRSDLRDQLDRCLCYLELLRNGEGVLFNTNLDSLNRSLDFYQCVQLLSVALRQHTALLSTVEREFETIK